MDVWMEVVGRSQVRGLTACRYQIKLIFQPSKANNKNQLCYEKKKVHNERVSSRAAGEGKKKGWARTSKEQSEGREKVLIKKLLFFFLPAALHGTKS